MNEKIVSLLDIDKKNISGIRTSHQLYEIGTWINDRSIFRFGILQEYGQHSYVPWISAIDYKGNEIARFNVAVIESVYFEERSE